MFSLLREKLIAALFCGGRVEVVWISKLVLLAVSRRTGREMLPFVAAQPWVTVSLEWNCTMWVPWDLPFVESRGWCRQACV